jgi:hypothetical protein
MLLHRQLLPLVEKKDIFKVILMVQGLNHNTGDIVTIVRVNGESRVKLFDGSKTEFKDLYIQDERPATSQAAKIPDGE